MRPTCAPRATGSCRRSTRRSPSAARRRFRWRSGTSRPPASRTGAACPRSSPGSTRRAGRGVDIAADTYAYPAWFNSMSAFVPPWAHDGGTAKLLARLRDPAARRRIRHDMLTPSDAWDNEWQEIPGPESVLISVGAEPGAHAVPGQDPRRGGKAPEEGPDRDAARHPDRGSGLYVRGGVRHVRAGRRAGVEAALDLGGQRFAGDVARGSAREGAPTSPRLRDVSADPQEVRARGAPAEPGGGDPEIHVAPGGRMRLADRGVLKAGMWADVVVSIPPASATRRRSPSRTSSPREWRGCW